MRTYSFLLTSALIGISSTLLASDASWSGYISTLVQTTDSLPLRLLLVTGLGMLLSLTPCIYPMIPITVGILQAQQSRSVVRNFCLALAYTMGIASTFALLGLSAAYTGQLFGSFMTKPIVIVPMVTLLLYLAGAMMGLYEMYTPSLLQNSSRAGGGSMVSAFLFGAASGTVASPCLSPGLILLLTIVTSLGNVFLGFALLFAFGIGLSIPLLLIGTFSSTLSLLPRAGMWMVEIKKLFGLVMIGMCFYFLQPLLTSQQLMICGRITMLALALYYIYAARTTYATTWRTTKYVLASGLMLCAAAGGTLEQLMYAHKESGVSVAWQTDYQSAHAYALQEHKPLFIDVTADYCSLCKAIEKKLFFDESVAHALTNFVSVKINASDTTNSTHQELLATTQVMGTPTFLVIDPQTDTVIARFGGELHDLAAQEFIALIAQYNR